MWVAGPDGDDGAETGRQARREEGAGAATRKRTIARLPKTTRTALQREARKGAARGGGAGHRLEDRNRQQLYETAKRLNIAGRSKMGKSQLIQATRRAS